MRIGVSQKELTTIREKNKNLNLFFEKKRAQSFNSLDIHDLVTAPLNVINVYDRVLKMIITSIPPSQHKKKSKTITEENNATEGKDEYNENDKKEEEEKEEKEEESEEEEEEEEEEDPDAADIGPASEIISAVCIEILTALQNSDDRYNAIKVMQRLGGISKVQGDNSSRRFIIEEDLTVVYPRRARPMRCFLFNDVLALGDRGKGAHAREVIPLSAATISSFVNAKKVGKPPLPSFQLAYDGGETLTLKFASSPERDKLWEELIHRVKEVKTTELYDPADSAVAALDAYTAVLLAGGGGGGASSSSSSSSLMFGSTIINVVAMEHRESVGVPSIVEKACVHMMRDLDCEGIFRLSGSSSKIAALKKAVSTNPDFAFGPTDDTLTVAALLKMFFRELEEPLLTFALYSSFVSVRISPVDEFVESIADLLNRLPFEHVQTYMYLMDFLVLIAQHKSNNMMDGNLNTHTQCNANVLVSNFVLFLLCFY